MDHGCSPSLVVSDPYGSSSFLVKRNTAPMNSMVVAIVVCVSLWLAATAGQRAHLSLGLFLAFGFLTASPHRLFVLAIEIGPASIFLHVLGYQCGHVFHQL